MPYLIAVSDETRGPARVQHEIAALFGEKKWQLDKSGQVTETLEPNGLFTMAKDGSYRYERISAVLVYRFKWLENGHEHGMHIYHNPYARMPVDPELFRGVPQLVFVGGSLQWLNGEPNPD